MRATLQVIGGPYAGKRVVLASGQSATFGRTPEADYQFADDPMMSSRHFAVRLEGEVCRVRDLESRNGTYVDDKRVLERALATGCVIRAGDTKFTVTLAEAIAMTQPSASVPGASGSPPREHASPLPPLADALSPLSFAPSGFAAPSAALPARPVAETMVATPRERWRSLASRAYELALDDADPLVRRNALLAAAWKGQKWVLEYCRAQAARPATENWDALLLLAIVGQREELPRVLAIGRAAELGPPRFAVLGAFGYPQVMSELLAGIESQDPAVASAAAAAFAKITGVEVAAKVAGADEVVPVPDAESAARQWRKIQSKFADSQRWRRGFDVSRGVSPDVLPSLDLESRWEACLRGHFLGTWKDSPLDREQLADKLASL
jgi:hypothetical protein